MIKRKIIAMLFATCLFVSSFTGCGRNGPETQQVTADSFVSNGEFSYLLTGFGSDNVITNATTTNKTNDEVSVTINSDMLVYTGTITVETKKYEESVAAVNQLLSSYDCFIEKSEERLRDDSDGALYTYDLVVRINSSQYNDLMNNVSKFGTVTSKTSSVENVTSAYNDIESNLELLRAKQDRYLKLLSETTDEATAVEIENKLDEIIDSIEHYETKKSMLELDVAYSYVFITISEIKEHVAQIEHDDTFFTRLWNQFVNTYYGFVMFLEDFVFFIINATPYVVLFSLIWIVLNKTGLIRFIPIISKFATKKRKVNKATETKLDDSK